MRKNFKIYSNSVLPKGFKYPKEYVELSKNMEPLEKIPYFLWWFEDCHDEDLLIEINSLKNLTGIDNLISFARDGDWAACFDITDCSGEPKVYVFDLGNKANRYLTDSFKDWLDKVILEALSNE